jgi:hypothetical protein
MIIRHDGYDALKLLRDRLNNSIKLLADTSA